MNKKTKKKVQEIIDKHYLTEWEFILEIVAPEIDQDEFEFNMNEISEILTEERNKRLIKLWK